MELGDNLNAVMQMMWKASSNSRWAKERSRRAVNKETYLRIATPLARMIVHLNHWQQGMVRLFKTDYIKDVGFVGSEHQSRCFMLVLKKFESAEVLANRLLKAETRTAIVYKTKDHEARCIPESKMREAMMYIFKFPTGGMHTSVDTSSGIVANATTENNVASGIPSAVAVPKNNVASGIPSATVATKKQRTDGAFTAHPNTTTTTNMPKATTTANMSNATTTANMPKATTTANMPKATTKHIVMLVLPKGVPVSSKEFFNAVSDITPLGCVMSSHFPLMVAKTCWRSLQVYPVDNWGKWKHIGMGKEPALHTHMLRISLAQASTVGE